jgi:hypothetical protein
MNAGIKCIAVKQDAVIDGALGQKGLWGNILECRVFSYGQQGVSNKLDGV